MAQNECVCEEFFSDKILPALLTTLRDDVSLCG